MLQPSMVPFSPRILRIRFVVELSELESCAVDFATPENRSRLDRRPTLTRCGSCELAGREPSVLEEIPNQQSCLPTEQNRCVSRFDHLIVGVAS
jgi:hypothetical protein